MAIYDDVFFMSDYLFITLCRYFPLSSCFPIQMIIFLVIPAIDDDILSQNYVKSFSS